MSIKSTIFNHLCPIFDKKTNSHIVLEVRRSNNNNNNLIEGRD